MNICIIAASTRAGARSRAVADCIAAELAVQKCEATVLDLFALNLPIYNDTKDGEWSERLAAAKAQLAASDGFVFVSPEWDGMMSAGLHNLFHYLTRELADKPVYLVSVSSGRGGRYPLIEMRMMGYKNRHFVVIPEALFIDHVNDNLVDGTLTNEHISTRLTYGINTLIEYAKALSQVRASGVLDYETFKNGL